MLRPSPRLALLETSSKASLAPGAMPPKLALSGRVGHGAQNAAGDMGTVALELVAVVAAGYDPLRKHARSEHIHTHSHTHTNNFC